MMKRCLAVEHLVELSRNRHTTATLLDDKIQNQGHLKRMLQMTSVPLVQLDLVLQDHIAAGGQVPAFLSVNQWLA